MTNNQKTFTSALEKAIAHSTMEVLSGETQLYSLVADYIGSSPQGKQSLNLLRNAIDCGIPTRMYGAASKDVSTQTVTVATCRRLLMDNYGISEEAAGQFMDGFAEAIGWKIAKPETGAPSPEPAVAPVIPTAPPTDPAMERIGNLCVTVPEQWFGEVMGNINRRRGIIRGLDTSKNGECAISAQVPELEMEDYAVFLARLTSETGHYTYSYDHDQPMPKNVAERQRAKAKQQSL